MDGRGTEACPPESWDTLNKQACSSVSIQHSTPYSALIGTVCPQTIRGLNFCGWRIFTIFRGFIFADVRVPNVTFMYNIRYICNIILV